MGNNRIFEVALVGNPNVGKSTIFNVLTGMHQHTGNWAGKTVANASGEYEYSKDKYKLIDLPGTYSLISKSEEEEIAKKYICSGTADCIVIVVDAVKLETNLYLVKQILEIQDKVIVCVNLLDEANKKGIHIDLKMLEKELKVPVIGVIAKKKKTLERLLKKIEDVSHLENVPENINHEKKQIETIVKEAEEICKKVVKLEKQNYNERDEKIDKILTSKLTGIPIMLLFLALIFWLTIVGANYPSELLSDLFTHIEEGLMRFCANMNTPRFLSGMLITGMFRTTAWVISVMLPPMAIFFPLFVLLEDFGYLPRIAFNLDNVFRKAKTTGKQALTMCMGFGCNAAGIIGCRIIGSTREKIIAMLTNSFVPCNGRFPILITISSIFIGGIVANEYASAVSTIAVIGIIIFGIIMTLIISNILSRTILKGEGTSFVLELPPYRRPQIIKVITRSIFDKTIYVLLRAVKVAAPAGIVIWLMANINIGGLNILEYVANFLEPLGRIMGLDGYILTAFILGLPANEIVLPLILMCYLSNSEIIKLEDITQIGEILKANGWNLLTAINVMIFTLLHFPCSTTLLTIKKEAGSIKWMLLAFAIPTVCGIIVCTLTNAIYNLIV